jgi:hypothetical protein
VSWFTTCEYRRKIIPELGAVMTSIQLSQNSANLVQRYCLRFLVWCFLPLRGAMDIWNILAGVASILSLIFHLSGKGSGVRPFTFPITMGLVGFCIGRAGSDAGTIANQFFQDPYLMLIIFILILLFSLAMYLVESNKLDVRMSYIFLVFLSTVALPYMLKFYGDISPNISTADYLVLAQVKENAGSMEEAIKYLKIYARRINQKDIQKQIDTKVDDLTKQKFKQDFKTPAKNNFIR